MIGATVKRYALSSVLFSAGVGTGFGGAEALRVPEHAPTHEILAAGLNEYIAGDALQIARAVVIYQDIQDDVLPGDSVTVSELPAYLSARLDYSDPGHASIGQQFVVSISETISAAVAAGTIPADAGVDLEPLMEACRDVIESYRGPLVLPPDPIDPIQQQRSMEQSGA